MNGGRFSELLSGAASARPAIPHLFLRAAQPVKRRFPGGVRSFSFRLPLDILMEIRLHNRHEYHVRQNCIILLVVALLEGPGFGVLTKKHLQTAVGETTAVFLYDFT